MTTDTSERGLERLICTALTGRPCDAALAQAGLEGEGAASSGAGWICGAPNDYDREYTVDLVQKSSQPDQGIVGRKGSLLPPARRSSKSSVLFAVN